MLTPMWQCIHKYYGMYASVSISRAMCIMVNFMGYSAIQFSMLDF